MSCLVPDPDMTYNVFGGTLNLALSIYHAWLCFHMFTCQTDYRYCDDNLL